MSQLACATPTRSGRGCIEMLADGYSHPTDLCWWCTRTFMAALDSAVGPLVWHPNYIERAKL